MKISARDAALAQITGIVLIVSLTIATMFYPDTLGTEHSLRSIEEKKAEILSLNGELSSLERDAQTAVSNLTTTKTNAELINKEADKLKVSIRNTEFGLDMPSILIALEQKAIEYNLEFLMDYDKLKMIDADTPTVGAENPELDTTEGALPADATAETTAKENETNQTESADTKTAEPEEETKQDEETGQKPEESAVANPTDLAAEKSEDVASAEAYNPEDVDITEAYENIPSIPGLSVTVIPVRVSGTYADVRSFIQYLENVDLISHNWVDLHSYGDNISGIIVFNVFHSKEGDSY